MNDVGGLGLALAVVLARRGGTPARTASKPAPDDHQRAEGSRL